MDKLWLAKYILFPVVIIIYYVLNTKKHEKSYQLVKSIWYFYYAIATVYNLAGEKSVTSGELAGFTVALALFEGLPGFIKLTAWKIQQLNNGNKNVR